MPTTERDQRNENEPTPAERKAAEKALEALRFNLRIRNAYEHWLRTGEWPAVTP
jgi:hypothetical protein